MKLGEILRQVEAKAIKERTEGIKVLRQCLESPGAFNRIAKSSTTGWSTVLDALYANLAIERETFDKARGKASGSTATVEKRLTETAMLIRYICENGVLDFQAGVARKLIRNLKDRMRRNTMTLLDPVVLDFVKALKILLSHPPHMHMLPREQDWAELTAMAFNVILDYPLNRSIEPEDSDEAMDVDASSDAQEEDGEEEEIGENGRASPRKRSRPPTKYHSVSGHSPTAATPTRLSEATREKREWIGLLSVLVSTHRNPMFHNFHLTPKVLGRITRILQSYTADSSIHHELLPALSCILSRLCLSQTVTVKKFAMDSWDCLVNLWGPKAKPFREHLIAVLVTLLPYYVLAGKKHDWGVGVERLYKVMDREVGTGRSLPLDAIRLEVIPRPERDGFFPAFSTPTFRAAPSFDQAQALTWATLELEADCILKLYERSESIHSYVTPTPTQRESKRPRLENPLKAILTGLQTHGSADAHIHLIQTVVFVIERHWPALHYDLQQDVKRGLADVMATQNQNSAIQSWVFIAFAAIAYAESRSSAKEADTTVITPDSVLSWEALWASCMRRANVPSVCRAACHAAVAILVHAYQAQGLASPLNVSSSAILTEIEILLKGLESQGPAFPCDSVCALLSRCLHVSSQDARLYRMRLEDIALAWLVECWRVEPTSKGDLPLYSVPDILRLLGSICSYKTVPDLLDRVLMPPCPIVDTLEEQARTKVIRDFLLEAKLPIFYPPSPLTTDATWTQHPQSSDSSGEAEPSARESKLSKFLNRCLERLVEAWSEQSRVPTAEIARRDLDMAVIAIAFEALRKANGIKRDKGVVKRALKFLRCIIETLRESKLMDGELAFILHALDPLICSSDDATENDSVKLFASVAPGAGIRSQLIRRLAFDSTLEARNMRCARIALQRLIWGDDDVNPFFLPCPHVLSVVSQAEKDVEEIRRTISGHLRDMTRMSQANGPIVNAVDDFFAVNRETRESARPTTGVARQRIIRTFVSALYGIPYLQSGQPTRATEFNDFLSGLVDNFDQRLDVLRALADGLEAHMLHIGANALATLLDDLHRIVHLYAVRDNAEIQLLVVRLLHATLPTWTSDMVDPAVFEMVGILNEWLTGKLRRRDFDWKVRSRLTRYFAAHVDADRQQTRWTDSPFNPRLLRVRPNRCAPWYYPRALLPWLVGDVDTRISFDAASLIPRVLQLGVECRVLDEVVRYVYECLGTCQGRSLESLLATILAMANMMITTVVRRRTYWNLLNSYFQVQSENQRFIEAVLRGILSQVAQRLGMSQASELFDVYASQIAFSMIKSGQDLNRLPPSILGYRDRLQCIAAGFRAFAPYLIGEKELATFQSYCTLLGKQAEDGIQECFGDVVGGIVAQRMDKGIDAELTKKVARAVNMDGGTFDAMLQRSLDAVTVAILRAMGELKLPVIIDTLTQECIIEMADTFRALTTHREDNTTGEHDEMLPSYSCATVIHCLNWCNSQGGNAADDPSRTYHILHELIADVQRHPMVVDQRRKVNALCIWVSAYSQHFEDNSVLYALMHGATVMLGHSDLILEAQSILDWALDRYGENFSRDHANEAVSERVVDPRFLDIFIRIASFANAYRTEMGTSELPALGERLAVWIDRKVARMCDEHGMTQHVLRVLPAWPYRPVDQRLLALHDELGPGDLSNVLANRRITTNKFALARRLRDYALAGVYDPADFAKCDFWHLKSHIPDSKQLDPEDIRAFATLLVSHQGRIDSFSDAALEIIKDVAFRQPRPRLDIVVILCDMLRSEDGARVHAAYSTLKLVMTVLRVGSSDAGLPAELQKTRSLTTEQRADLRHLMKYPRVLRQSRKPNLREALRTDEYMRLAHTFRPWVTSVTVLLSGYLGHSDIFFTQLIGMLESDEDFAKRTFATLLHTLLQLELDHAQNDQLRYRQSFSVYFTEVLRSTTAHPSCKEVIVQSILHLRRYQPRRGGKEVADACAYDKWLDIDHILMAKSALSCRMYTTSLLFLDLATEYNSAAVDESAVEHVLYEIYSHIDEPDGFYAIKTNDLQQFLLRRVRHERQWDKAFRLHGAAMETDHTTPADQLGLLQSFHAFGFHGLALNAMPSLAEQSATGLSYELGWRTGTWDLPDNAVQESNGASLYFALRAVHRERNSASVDAAVQQALACDMAQLRALGHESLSEIRDVARRIMCLNQVAQWNDPDFQAVLSSRDTTALQWRDLVRVNNGLHFQDLENIVATRICLLQSIRQKEERDQIGDLVSPWKQMLVSTERRCLVRLSEAARKTQETQLALNSITRAQRLGRAESLDIEQEYANVLWVHQEKRLAIELLRRILRDGNPLTAQTDEIEKAVLRARMGTWVAEACLEKPEDILKNWFGPAADLLSQVAGGSPTKRMEVYRQCAVFAERQYYSLFRSGKGRRLKAISEHKEKEIQAVENANKTPIPVDQKKENHKMLYVMKIQLETDRANLKEHIEGLEAFLAQALNMHSRCLAAGDAYDDDAPIRLCSLWFSNWHNRKIQDTADHAFGRIPSRKLVFLSHQLSARLSKGDEQTTANQTTLRKLVLRMCKEHPFHCLYQVFCLQASRGRRDAPSGSQREGGRRQSARHTPGIAQTPEPPTATQADRSETAGDLYDKLRREDPRVEGVDRLCYAALEWAVYPITKRNKKDGGVDYSRGQFAAPSSVTLFKLRDLKVPVMTADTPIDPTSRYDNCAWLAGYEPSFSTMGGLALPKVTSCRDVYGQMHKQLFKGEGNDDLRQDAVMEQVFELCNRILQRDQETRRRRLAMRCYKVIPLTTQAGVLQFVTNTLPMNAWLLDAHQRYHPEDIRTKDFYTLLENKQAELKKQPEKLTKWFTEIVTKRHKPVMRHFFREKHKEPTAWFATRLNYTRSVAVTSIVGHILGLGDRHISNILLDQHNGEVIHIDLGIAFDQGRFLPVPERVPFRMTRDMVDGMGASGTQGVFQRCAEETLRVLRGGSEIIMTVLEVFKHDPLHSWCRKEQERRKAEGDAFFLEDGLDIEGGASMELANRALSSVARKLDGALSVEFTVNELIAEATDMHRLATIFKGERENTLCCRYDR
ncbi:hypothetical protein HDZ31DRAFT_31492 [Schizophyllum fasciatum]